MKKKLMRDLLFSYGIQCEHYEPIPGGWQNEKWMVQSPQGIFLVKQFSLKRYTWERLIQMEKSLHAQVAMWEAGIPCDPILLFEDKTMRFLDRETVYMVMGYAIGHQETPETITLAQMRSLGNTARKMRHVFDSLNPAQVLEYPKTLQDFENRLRDHFAARIAEEGKCEAYEKALAVIEPVLKKMDVSSYELGIGHEDFAWDNMLFQDDEVAAILDFDRVQYGIKLHDIGRALMSLAFNGESFDKAKINAFLEGYQEPIDVVAAIRAVFYVEMPWWIWGWMFEETNTKILRFKDEVLWIAEHWDTLQEEI